MALLPMNIVGHRGLPQHYPENSLAGIKAALIAGAKGIEVDIQFTKDGEPVLMHDLTLKRVTGLSGNVAAFELALLNKMSGHEPARFNHQFLPTPIAPLHNLVPVMQSNPNAVLFVEIKEESFAHISREQVVAKIATVLAPIAKQCVIISFDITVLRLVREALDWPVGWVLSQYNEEHLLLAKEFQPEFLICNITKLPAAPADLWLGLWQWFIYDITDQITLRQLSARGVTWVESWDVAALCAAVGEQSR